MKAILNEKTKSVLSTVQKFLAACGIPDMFMCRFVGIYFLITSVVLEMKKDQELNAITQWKDYVLDAPVGGSVLWMVFLFLVFTLIYYFVPQRFRFADQAVLFVGLVFFVFSVTWQQQNENYYFAISITALAVIFISYLMGKVSHERLEQLPSKITLLLVILFAGATAAYVAVMSVMRHRVFADSCFDFGIFVQMFHSLKTNLTAMTTCERNTMLSHFNVHASFIYYLFLPFYMIYPDENTLLIGQAVFAMGGIIPLYLITKNHGYKGAIRVAACCVYIFYAGLLAPSFYDFHENAFLPTILMWLLYAVDKRKYILFYVMSVLTCIVKEDAPLYVMCIGLYVLIEEKTWKRLHGLAVLLLSGIYFVIISGWLAKYGDGQMMASTRFNNLTLESGDSFASIIRNVLVDPAYFFSTCMRDTCLLFFLEVMVPLMFLPFMTKKLHRYLLMIPFIIMNLVISSSYIYAAGLGFQYIYGPSALLIYLFVLNADDISYHKRNTIMVMAAVASLISSNCFISGKQYFWNSYQERPEYYRKLEACLDTIPEDGRAISNTWFLTHIADRAEVYIFDGEDFDTDGSTDKEFADTLTGLKDREKYDFYVLSRGDENTRLAIPFLEAENYTIWAETENYIVIYVSPEYMAAHPGLQPIGNMG